MENKYLYLMLNLGTISVPLIASFYTKANFSKTWFALLPAIIIPGVIFIVWDIIFTNLGVWGFSNQYLIGTRLFNLPIEEWMFFITVPYACTFTHFALAYLFPTNPIEPFSKWIAISIIGISLIGVLRFHDKIYTSLTLVLVIIILAYLLSTKKHEFLGRFFLTFAFIMIPFAIVNGILTGSGIENEVVWYNNLENSGMRVFTIPIEDFFYCLLLLLSNTYIYERLKGTKETNLQ